MKLKNILTTLFIILLALILKPINAQEKQYKVGCIGFYNLENLYDTIHQEGISDEEFTPDGKSHWTSERYNIKIKHLSEVIAQIGDELVKGGPILIGFAEVENRSVVQSLIDAPALKPSNYGIVHYDSPDKRGVDVALIYQKDHFKVINSYPVPLNIPDMEEFKTRDQLVVKGLFDGEPLNIIVNHWPSRSRGQSVSEPLRIAAAKLCRSIADSMMRADQNAKVIIMGDLNDDPIDESLTKAFGANKSIEDTKPGNFYNPMYKLFKDGIGSLAYRDEWNLFDQIIVSYPLLGNDKSKYKFFKAKVCNKSFLATKEGAFKGYPFRTYVGTTWQGGYSDHFPVYIFLVKEK